MKKIICSIIVCVLFLGMSGCGSKDGPEIGYRNLKWNMEKETVQKVLSGEKDLLIIDDKEILKYGSTDTEDPLVLASLGSGEIVYEEYTFVDGLSKVEISFSSTKADLITYLNVLERLKKSYGAEAVMTYHSDISDNYALTTENVEINVMRILVADGHEISIIIEPVTNE